MKEPKRMEKEAEKVLKNEDSKMEGAKRKILTIKANPSITGEMEWEN